MLKELEALTENITMREFIPERQHRCWKESFLNKTRIQVIAEIRRYQRRNTK